ncbi:MAG: hypothetical protein K0R29_2424 [Pseudobdellovibrio sp.]|nr:hypothetical protein [Pseudobdellovibrio sp.]
MNLLIGLCALRFVASIFPPAQQLLWANLGKDILISNLVIFSLLIYLSFKKVAYARAFTMAWSFSIFSLAILGTLKLGWLEHTWVLGFAPLLTRPLQFFALTHLVFEKLKQLLHDYTLAQLEAKQFKLTRQLLRSVSHDLSNTTNSMDFISEFALTKTGDQAVMQRSLSDINKAAKIQSQIIKTAKDLAKSKDQPLKLTEVGLRESIRESLLVLDSKIKNKNLKIIVDSPAELFVLADKTCLTYQVVANLLDNAVKFTPAGKNIYVRLFTNIENEVVLEIEDEGIGIPEKLKSEIFKSSVKVSRKGTEGEESTGLGLLIVHDYIEMFGGSVGFESRELGGTKFTVKFKPADVSVAL